MITTRTALVGFLMAGGAAPACEAEPGSEGQAEAVAQKLEVAREVSEKYRAGVHVAEADGYQAASPCEQSAEGAMGIHYVNPTLAAAPPELGRPAILVYFPEPQGLKLVALEYVQFVIQDGKPHTGPASEPPRPDSLPPSPPQLFDGLPFDGPMAGHAPGRPWHYDQHVWLYQENPRGMFAMWNPALRCPEAH